MLKDATYQTKFKLLDTWLTTIVDQIKKDLKQDHLQKDPVFCKVHFPGKNISKVTVEEMTVPYRALLEKEGSEDVSDFITNRWLLKNADIYHFFEEKLKAISPDFNELDIIDEEKSKKIVEESVKQFGAPKTYIFSVLNSVVFPENVYKELAKKAEAHRNDNELAVEKKKEQQTIDNIQKNHDAEIARLTNKFEKTILGLQKKYLTDTEALKKQIATLQRKLSSHS